MTDGLQSLVNENKGESLASYALVAGVVAVIVNPALAISTLHRLADLLHLVAERLTFLA